MSFKNSKFFRIAKSSATSESATIATVQYSTVEAGTCTSIFNRCDDIDCSSHCQSAHGTLGVSWRCDLFNLCTCTFNQDPSSNNLCRIGMGTCYQDECDQSCCNAKCAGTYKEGFGSCIPNQFTKDRCVCSYRS
ncbi:defensin-like protein 181 isoform X2 [Medicago truncatula]|uniref:defensin-like protein 181 isoform X2 n=1 Tax=Medicago truncatula TaxID=3880 RepID=UPI001967973C|nr:defensin-like protein 181 isoform X2 [Medicago truncatula]